MILFVDRLTNIDFSYLDHQRGVLGETFLANVRLVGELDEQSMVCDFGRVKKTIRHWLDTELDHRLAVPAQSPHIKIEEEKDYYSIRFELANQTWIQTRSPKSSIALIDTDVITAESLANWAGKQILTHFPLSVARMQLEFSNEDISGAYYHYTHGLKKHNGNCQRIAHGHRSRIDIWANEKKSPLIEQFWADEWRDIYIGSREDLVKQFEENGQTYLSFAYKAEQGNFEITLPKSICYLIDCDTTVELLAWHIAQRTRQLHPQYFIRVKAYEGFG
ncbi:MAG: 6-carboxytetrahydropterin synthase [Cellvibrio sp.]|nr:6-carboxytetrahydropterin synthase [Cellvibrio sp.]